MKSKRLLVIGVSFIQDVLVSNDLDNAAEMRYMAAQINGPLTREQTSVSIRPNSLPYNDPVRLQMEQQLAAELDELSDQVNDVESFDLIDDPRQNY